MRTARQHDLSNRTKRRKLKPRSKPYFASIESRLTLGYLARWPATGVWLARRELRREIAAKSGLPYAVYEQWQIGHADDTAPANGRDVFTFEQAKARAAAEAKKRAPGAQRHGELTVKGAIEQYLTHIQAHNGERARKDAENKLNVYVLGITQRGPDRIPREHRLGDVHVNKLTLGQLTEWQASMIRRDGKDADIERRSQDSANRVLASFKAALNHAFEDEANGVESDHAWRRLKAFRDVGSSREDHFTEAEVLTLIEAAAKQEQEFANVIEAVFHTGARPPHEIAALDVRHFDARRAQLTIPDGKTGSRITTLSPEGVAFFKRLAEGKKPRDVLLPRPDGTRWGKSHQHRRMRDALKAAELSATASLYTVRHTYISRALERGMRITDVAENVGTSVRMIEQNYRKSIASVKREHIQQTAPILRVVKASVTAIS